MPLARAVGYAEMTGFEYLTENREVQTTTFANGVEVIVNFGEQDFTLKDGSVIKALDYRVNGLDKLTVKYPEHRASTIETSSETSMTEPAQTTEPDVKQTEDAKLNTAAIFTASIIIGVVSLAAIGIWLKKRRGK